MNAILHAPFYGGLSPIIGRLCRFDASGQALVALPSPDMPDERPAPSLCLLGQEDIGSELLLVFVDDDPACPVILGKLHTHVQRQPGDEAPEAHIDGKRIVLEAAEQLELKCGKAHICLAADGRISIRGGYILNHASGINRIRGAAVKIN